MMTSSEYRAVDDVASYLPFDVLDIQQANDAFVHWRAAQTDEARHVVDLWTYCYVRRYFLAKFAQRNTRQAADLEMVISRAFRKATGRMQSVKNPDRYAHWVSVICRNTFINYLRSRRDHQPLPEGGLAAPQPHRDYGDAALMAAALEAAIGRLPEFLQEVAYLRLVEEVDYEEISRRVDKPLPILRSYVSKSLKRLRKDPALLQYLSPRD